MFFDVIEKRNQEQKRQKINVPVNVSENEKSDAERRDDTGDVAESVVHAANAAGLVFVRRGGLQKNVKVETHERNGGDLGHEINPDQKMILGNAKSQHNQEFHGGGVERGFAVGQSVQNFGGVQKQNDIQN
jgi:hypothetical protein